MGSQVVSSKKLSRKRFIPLFCMLAIGVIGVCWKDSTIYSIKCAIQLLQHPFRQGIIYSIGLVIGISHFYYVGLDKGHHLGFMGFSTGVFSSIANAVGFSFMMNKGLSFSIGVIGDSLKIKPYFVDGTDIDYITLSLVSFLVVFLSGYMLWKLAEEFLYEIKHPSSDVEGVQNPKDQKSAEIPGEQESK